MIRKDLHRIHCKSTEVRQQERGRQNSPGSSPTSAITRCLTLGTVAVSSSVSYL